MAGRENGIVTMFKKAPRLLLLILAVTGSALIALNMAMIVCFCKRKRREDGISGEWEGEEGGWD